jgi:pimeloyl-ACP methyl ester carboxylesterase
MGGTIALQYALDHPGDLGRLVVVASPAYRTRWPKPSETREPSSRPTFSARSPRSEWGQRSPPAPITPSRRATGTPLALGLLARSRALVAAPRGQPGVRGCVSLLARSRTAPQLARTHLLYGEWLRRQRRRGEARDQGGVEAMGFRCFAERTRVQLGATG